VAEQFFAGVLDETDDAHDVPFVVGEQAEWPALHVNVASEQASSDDKGLFL
jgi:hypothetical protein